MAFRKEKLTSLLERIIREFIYFNVPFGNNQIILTRIELAPNFKKAVIFTLNRDRQSHRRGHR